MEKILIADDNVQITKILSEFARKEGFEPVTAFDGEEVIEQFQKDTFAVILLDVMMPKKDGFEVCREIRNSITPDGMLDYDQEVSDECKYIVNNIILEYGSLASWKLSELSHREISWRNARAGLGEGENGTVKLKLSDIREDARKVRPYDHVWDMYYDEFEDEEPSL